MNKLMYLLKASLLLLPLLLAGCNQGDSSASNMIGSNKQVVIYSADWCGPCKQLKRQLDRNDIAYTEYDVDRNPRAKAEMRRMGVSGLPTTVIGDKVIEGYKPRAIMAALSS